MVGGAARGRAGMGAAGDDLEVGRDHDPVELGDRPAGVEAAPARREAMMGGEVAQAAAARAPFVEVAHQHARQRPLALGEMGEDGVGLAPPPQARKVEMHADDAQRGAVDPDLGADRAARLERGQMEQVRSSTSTFLRTSRALPCQPMLPARVSSGTGL